MQKAKRSQIFWPDGNPRGVELEYRVVAVNKAGEGAASNTVMVVL